MQTLSLILLQRISNGEFAVLFLEGSLHCCDLMLSVRLPEVSFAALL